MERIILTSAFLAVLLGWLRLEFNKKVSYKKHWLWLLATLVVQQIAAFVFMAASDRVVGNFYYHAIGGGVASTLMFVYLLKTFSLRFSWRVELVLLYCFVSALGVLNELAEYAGEFIFGNGTFSWDSHDTWRDFVANTSGAIVAWSIYKLCLLLARFLARNRNSR